jgi:hypothetical protein
VNMYAAITLSVGNKAKTRDADGNTLVVELHYAMQYEWTMSQIQQSGAHDGYIYGNDFRGLSNALELRDVSPDDNVWLSVETPFSEEKE